ncbi:HlyD family secretion protein [Xanthomonas sp. 60]
MTDPKQCTDETPGSTREPGTDNGPGRDDEKGSEAKKPSPLKNPKVRWTLTIIGVAVLVILIAWLVYHLLVGRYLQDTNNAYLQADAVAVAPRINGYVTEVLVQDNQWVKAGEPLLRIDPRTYRATLDQAEAVIAVREADIAAARAGVQGQQSSLVQARSQLAAATASLRFARAEVARFTPLAASGADTHEHVESLRHELERAQAQYEAAKAQIEGAQSQIEASQAQLEQAQAGLKQAQADATQAGVAFEDTELRARIDGRVGNKTVQVGQFIAAGTRTMTIVPVSALYLSANFKETQVGLMRPGQPAEIKVDALPGTTLQGVVESISPGTGSQFALLPPQNATGNFTKVVQRVPVRIRVEAGPEARNVLVPGMSVDVTVDTRSAKQARDRTKDEAKAAAAR